MLINPEIKPINKPSLSLTVQSAATSRSSSSLSSLSLPPSLPAAALIDVECDRVNNWTFLIIVIKAAVRCGDGSSGGAVAGGKG